MNVFYSVAHMPVNKKTARVPKKKDLKNGSRKYLTVDLEIWGGQIGREKLHKVLYVGTKDRKFLGTYELKEVEDFPQTWK